MVSFQRINAQGTVSVVSGREASKVVVTTFSKGMYSDFTELTTPPGITTDEANCTILETGIRTRRRGMAMESSYQLNDGSLTQAQAASYWFENFEWKPVANIGNLIFTVLQVGNLLYFYDAASPTLSQGMKSFTVNLNSFKAPVATDTSTYGVQVATIKGALVVTGISINPFYIVYSPDTDTIATTTIDIKVRDFSELDKSVSADALPVAPSVSYKYDLFNQGWYHQGIRCRNENGIETSNSQQNTLDILTKFVTGNNEYPSKNGAWFLGKFQTNVADNPVNWFSTRQWQGTVHGNGKASFGHFILEAFNKDRSTVSGFPGITSEIENDRPEAVAVLAGHVFFALKNTVYFSPLVIDDLTIMGNCYQIADPTSEDDADLVETDGGVVVSPEIGRILKLYTVRTSIVIFADNGVWLLQGANGDSFTAKSYSVSKISSTGIFSARSVVDTEGLPIWWGYNSIFTLTPSNLNPTLYEVTSTIDKRLLNYYNNIPALSKQYAKGFYDPISKTVSWLFKSETNTPDSTQWKFQYDSILNFSTIYDAYYPYTFDSSQGPFIAGILNINTITQIGATANVVDASGNLVVDGSSNQVVVDLSTLEELDTTVKFWVIDASYKWTFGVLDDTSFLDFSDLLTNGLDYSSYLTTYYLTNGDDMAYLQAPFLFAYLKNTEQQTPSVESSCFLQARWDWSNSSAGNKWGTPIQLYKKRMLLFTNDDGEATDSGYPIVTTRNKLRGKGRALQLHYYSETGKDFQLVGWNILTSKAGTP